MAAHWHNDGIPGHWPGAFWHGAGRERVPRSAAAPFTLGDDVNARGYLKLDGAGTRWDSSRITVANLGQGT